MINVISYDSPVNFICSAISFLKSYPSSVLYSERISCLLFSSHHKTGSDQMSFLWDSLCGFPVIILQGCSYQWVKTLTLLYSSYSRNYSNEVVGMPPFKKMQPDIIILVMVSFCSESPLTLQVLVFCMTAVLFFPSDLHFYLKVQATQ